MNCKVTFCNATDVVYSGVDAFLLGVPTETVCYAHARDYELVKEFIA